MTADREIIDKGIAAALRLAADRAWSELTLKEIATEADLTLSDFHGRATKDTLAAEIDPHFDRSMSSEPIDMTDDARTRLFDVIMLRFEAMEEQRSAVLSWMKARDTSPRLLMERVAGRRASANWALVSAGLDNNSGAPMPAKILAIAWVIAQTERAWKKETSSDFSRTMAALDKELRSAEERMGWLDMFRSRSNDSGSSDDDQDEPEIPSEPDYLSEGSTT